MVYPTESEDILANQVLWFSETDLEKAEILGTEVSKFVLEAQHFGEICTWFSQLIVRISLLIRWNSKINLEKAERKGTEVLRFVLGARHFGEICAWFAHLIARNVLADQVKLLDRVREGEERRNRSV